MVKSKWIVNGDSVSYKLDNKYTLYITKDINFLDIKVKENDPPCGRTDILYCKKISNSQLGFKFTK